MLRWEPTCSTRKARHVLRFWILILGIAGKACSILHARLNRDQIPAYGEQSRRGGHLWFFFDQPVAGREARTFAQRIQHKYHIAGM